MNLQKTLVYNPSNRISSRALLQHEYFNGLDLDKLPAGNYRGELKLPGKEGDPDAMEAEDQPQRSPLKPKNEDVEMME